MSKEEKQAADLQHNVRMDEHDRVQDYDEEQVKQAVVHARQDIVLLVSYATSIIKILKSIRFILGAILVLFVIYFFFN
tara:strand:+ start:107 stop:340 length:234 start_codon:yes stop_codon:yes gene_type:complete